MRHGGRTWVRRFCGGRAHRSWDFCRKSIGKCANPWHRRGSVLIRLLLAAILCTAPLHAAWTVRSVKTLPAPAGLAFIEREMSDEAGGSATLWTVTFEPKTHAFAVMDNPEGDFNLGSAAAKRGALAGVNGGYFQPDRTPLGLVVRKGAQLHPLEKSRLLSGVVSVTPAGIAIQRSGAFKLTPAVREALQAGPFLIENGKKIDGLNATKSAARTIVFLDTKGRAGFLICKSTTLAETADLLGASGLFPDAKILRALNLDGGSSTALWVRGEPPHYQREWKTVRNYLAIVPR